MTLTADIPILEPEAMRGRAGRGKKFKKVSPDPKELPAATDNLGKIKESRITDKGKPLERLGRKAEGLTRDRLIVFG